MSGNLNSLYPEITEHGSLSNLLRAAFGGEGPPPAVRGFEEHGWSPYWAMVEYQGRMCQVTTATEKRLFLSEFWERGVVLGSLAMDSLPVLLEAVGAWCVRRVDSRGLAAVTPLVTIDPTASAYEAGPAQYVREQSRSIEAGRRGGKARARGVLLLGPPGVGKSLLCKALGNETGRPTLMLDVGSLLGSLVGQSEQNLRQALRIADAMSPAVLFCDEVEKALSGVASSGQTDSGVSARIFGSLLTWLNDRTSDTYFVASCNDVSKLPPEFARAERVDGVFFLDLPGTAEKDRIWPLYLRKYGLDENQRRPEDRDWTGAEIASCCRLAALLDLPLKEAARNVVPVAVTAAESVERLRNWAAGRCLDASRGGIYARGNPEEPRAARRVSRPSSN